MFSFNFDTSCLLHEITSSRFHARTRGTTYWELNSAWTFANTCVPRGYFHLGKYLLPFFSSPVSTTCSLIFTYITFEMAIAGGHPLPHPQMSEAFSFGISIILIIVAAISDELVSMESFHYFYRECFEIGISNEWTSVAAISDELSMESFHYFYRECSTNSITDILENASALPTFWALSIDMAISHGSVYIFHLRPSHQTPPWAQ